MADNISSAPISNSAPAMDNSPAPASDILSTDDLFSKAEQFFLGDNEQQVQDNNSAAPAPKLNKMVGSDNTVVEDKQTNIEEDDEDLPLYHYEGKVGNEVKNIEIKDKEHLDRVIQKGLLAEQVYKEYKNQIKLVESYKEKANAMEAMDKLLDEGKHSEVLDMIVEDMDENTLLAWVQGLIDNKQKPAEVRDFEKQKKEIERYRRERDWEEKQRAQIIEQKAQLAQKQEEQQLHTWANSEFTKYASKFPDEHKPWLNKQIQLVIANAYKNMDNDTDLTIGDLSRELRDQLKPVLSRMTSGKINQELGRATDAKKMDALTRLQNSSSKSSGASLQKSRLDAAAESGDIGSMFDAFADMI